MKRLKRNPGRFETLDLYRALAERNGYRLSDPDTSRRFMETLQAEFSKAKSTPITMYGLRTEAMFAYVAAALGNCTVIKHEDAGEIHATDDNLQAPDYRLLLQDGHELLVEVKNFYQNDPSDSYHFKTRYLDGLRRYAGLWKRELKIAIYWSRWNMWTLVPDSRVNCEGKKCSISLVDAAKYNEMNLLGDHSVATLSPLVCRVVADPGKPRLIEPNGGVEFTIGGVEFYCGGRRIEDARERALAFYFMNFGRWPVEDTEAEVEDDQLIALAYKAVSEEITPEHEFQMLGTMSGMISREYDFLTTSEGSMERLTPVVDGSALGIRIPRDFEGQDLPLWRFFVRPKNDW